MIKERKIAKALSDNFRVQLLKVLKDKGPMTIQELANILGRHRSSIYRHLLLLEDAELVTRTRDSKSSAYVYAITKDGLDILDIYENKQGADILFEIRRKRVSKFATYKKLGKYVVYTPSLVLLFIAIKGAAYPGYVHAFSRMLWFIIFTSIALVWFLIARRISRTTES